MRKLIKIIGAKKISFIPFPIFEVDITHYFSKLDNFSSNYSHYFSKLDDFSENLTHYFSKLDTVV